jgi:hypothetical protein
VLVFSNISTPWEKGFACDACDHRTISAGMLSRHKLRSHVGVSFPCGLCSFKTSRTGKLKQHRLVAHPDAGEQQQQQLGNNSRTAAAVGSELYNRHHLSDVKPGIVTFS